MDGFVHNAEGYLNYYYWMAFQFAISDRWFSPVSSKSAPIRIATDTGGTTQGLVFDPGNMTIFLNSPLLPSFRRSTRPQWVMEGVLLSYKRLCLAGKPCGYGAGNFPATYLNYIGCYHKYLYQNQSHAACTAQPSLPAPLAIHRTSSASIPTTSRP